MVYVAKINNYGEIGNRKLKPSVANVGIEPLIESWAGRYLKSKWGLSVKRSVYYTNFFAQIPRFHKQFEDECHIKLLLETRYLCKCWSVYGQKFFEAKGWIAQRILFPITCMGGKIVKVATYISVPSETCA